MSIQVRALGWKPYRFYIFAVKDGAEGRAELGVAIHEQVFLAEQEAVHGVGELSSYLFHPGFSGVGGASRKMNSSRFEFHNEEQVKRDQPSPGPHLNCRKIDRAQHIPMCFDERLPGGLVHALSCVIDSIIFEDVGNGLIGDLVSQILHASGDLIESPPRIFLGDANDK